MKKSLIISTGIIGILFMPVITLAAGIQVSNIYGNGTDPTSITIQPDGVNCDGGEMGSICSYYLYYGDNVFINNADAPQDGSPDTIANLFGLDEFSTNVGDYHLIMVKNPDAISLVACGASSYLGCLISINRAQLSFYQSNLHFGDCSGGNSMFATGCSIDNLNAMVYSFFSVMLDKYWVFIVGFGVLAIVWVFGKRIISNFN